MPTRETSELPPHRFQKFVWYFIEEFPAGDYKIDLLVKYYEASADKFIYKVSRGVELGDYGKKSKLNEYVENGGKVLAFMFVEPDQTDTLPIFSQKESLHVASRTD